MHHSPFRSRRSLCATLATAPLAAAFGGRAFAQPAQRPIALVVPYPPGGSTDLLGRLYAEAMTAKTGEKLVIENRPGGNSTIGAAQVAGAAPDGRTLLYGYGNLLMNQQFLMKEARVHALRDLVPIARTAVATTALITSAESPVKDLADFIALARRNPGKHSYAYYGELAIVALAAEAGLSLIRVPYKGGGAASLTDIATGRVDVMYSSVTQAQPMLRAGKIKVLAIFGEQRSPDFPNVPTVSEVLPKVRSVDYQVVFAPKGTPKAVVDELHAKSVQALDAPEVRQRFSERGATVALLNPEQTRAYMEADLARIAEVVKTAGIAAE
ncbi:MAG: tripartite tricarboxylate transporter substrate binding protein [Burkholderiaceae bacterium]